MILNEIFKRMKAHERGAVRVRVRVGLQLTSGFLYWVWLCVLYVCAYKSEFPITETGAMNCNREIAWTQVFTTYYSRSAAAFLYVARSRLSESGWQIGPSVYIYTYMKCNFSFSSSSVFHLTLYGKCNTNCHAAAHAYRLLLHSWATRARASFSPSVWRVKQQQQACLQFKVTYFF